jgi:hypothetical protein
MTDENVFRWVQPTPFRATHKKGGILDFVFLSGPAKTWTAKSEVVKLPDDNVDTLLASDHRPVQADLSTFTTNPGAIVKSVGKKELVTESAVQFEHRQKKRDEILKRLAELEKELTALRRLVKDLADE